LNPDYKPSCSIYLAPAALIYSIYTENDSLVVPEHRSVDSTEIAYIEGHSLLINKDVPLKNGDYVLKYAFYDYDNKPVEGRLVFTVKDGKSEFSTAVPARKAASQVQVLVSGRDMLISGAKNTPFAVFNSMGQVVARGRLAGSASVALPAPGVYLVKIGNTMRRVKAQ
jgi:hypothetical protein